MRIGAKNPIRKLVGAIDIYHNNKGSIVSAVDKAFDTCDLCVDWEDLSGESGSVVLRIRPADTTCVVCDCCAEKLDSAEFDNCFALQWYTMGTGRIEYNGYIS